MNHGRRRHPRFLLESAVKFTRWDPNALVFGLATDISVGGAFIETAFPPPTGSGVVVRTWSPDWDEEVQLVGVVCWTGRRGMGVQFIAVGPREGLAIQSMVGQYIARNAHKWSSGAQ